MRLTNCFWLLVLFCISLILSLPAGTSAADEWQPVNPADLTLRDNPASPGSDAMILYREEHTDASRATFDEYYRVKICSLLPTAVSSFTCRFCLHQPTAWCVLVSSR